MAELEGRQAVLQEEARAVLAELDLSALGFGPALPTGSDGSGPMVRNVTAWHERLRSTITPEQRTAVLRIKDDWHLRPEYPDEVGGADIYSAVLDDGVGDPEGFATWLTRRASSVSGA